MNHKPARYHDLKTWPPYFEHVKKGRKTFEFRKNDRGFEVGDIVILREWLPTEQKYTGRVVSKRIEYLIEDETLIPSEYCIFSLGPTLIGEHSNKYTEQAGEEQ
jgi:hypothetical protein